VNAAGGSSIISLERTIEKLITILKKRIPNVMHNTMKLSSDFCSFLGFLFTSCNSRSKAKGIAVFQEKEF